MQANNETQKTSPQVPLKKRRITIENDYLRKINQRFAFATILIPFAGLIIAIGLFVRSGFDGVSISLIGIFLSIYILAMLGITVGFHRLFTHGTFKTSNAKIQISIT